MNIDQAKKTISINEYLQNSGYQPVSLNGVRYKYLSPFREENKASFDVNDEKRTFIDWGTGQRGTIIDLVMFLHHTDIPGALEILTKFKNQPEKPITFSFKKQIIQIEARSMSGTIEKINSKGLKRYLDKRCISYDAWSNCSHLFEYSYPNPRNPESNKLFHNLAWKNDRGGYELNNYKFKSCLTSKEITTIHGSKIEINVFEGFFDYLSALTYYKINRFEGLTIVLNSVILLDRIIEDLKSFKVVNSFLDNDKAGETAFSSFTNHHTNIVNQSKIIYPNHKDFNELLIDLNKYETNHMKNVTTSKTGKQPARPVNSR